MVQLKSMNSRDKTFDLLFEAINFCQRYSTNLIVEFVRLKNGGKMIPGSEETQLRVLIQLQLIRSVDTVGCTLLFRAPCFRLTRFPDFASVRFLPGSICGMKTVTRAGSDERERFVERDEKDKPSLDSRDYTLSPFRKLPFSP